MEPHFNTIFPFLIGIDLLISRQENVKKKCLAITLTDYLMSGCVIDWWVHLLVQQLHQEG